MEGPHLVWTIAKIVSSSTKQGSIYIPKESWTFSKRPIGERHHPYCKRGYNHYTWRHIRRQSHRHIVEKAPGGFDVKKRKVDGKAVNAVNG
jgi:hypothetical protein